MLHIFKLVTVMGLAYPDVRCQGVSIVIMSHVTSLYPGPQVSLSLDSAVGSPERDSFTFQS